ncbi:unnamed protein product [Caenorhabditis angaria]|uniref:Uncharacterized protein n=1 Tax=Caenorhabditis angaria TaxID=860376 RepID=A0A9P1MUM6_9PELO|nr:unnamed protein product [Caenorhabditis angaria]
MFKIFLIFLLKNISTSIDYYYEAEMLYQCLLNTPGHNLSSLITIIYEKKYGERHKLIKIFERLYGEEMYEELWDRLDSLAPRELTMGIIDNTPTYYDAKVLVFALTGIDYDLDPFWQQEQQEDQKSL